ncbi:hypothetical protein [uncultured Mycobacterium sp.]|uniref:hypothetical protein n=1 Tax=uncultured Mycobacterium sp. TaxID=171292 RepID=UPI0035CC8C7D
MAETKAPTTNGALAKQLRANWLRYVLAAAFCLLALSLVLLRSDWYGGVILFGGGILILYGRGRRILRAGVRRFGDEIICRYIPLYEGYTYVFATLFPALGIACLVGGFAPGYPVWLRFGGILLLCVSAAYLVVFMWRWRRSQLCITPSTLRVRGALGARTLTEIPRDLVQSIDFKTVRDGIAVYSRVDVGYRDAGTGCTNTVLLGPQLSVEPVNLANGLLFWKYSDGNDPGERLNQVEHILRQGPPAGA